MFGYFILKKHICIMFVFNAGSLLFLFKLKNKCHLLVLKYVSKIKLNDLNACTQVIIYFICIYVYLYK